MTKRELKIMTAVKALVRGDLTVRGLAERFGVTEAQVESWKDVFEMAGTLALADNLGRGHRRGRRRRQRQAGDYSEPTTTPLPYWSEPTTTPLPYWSEPTTTPLP